MSVLAFQPRPATGTLTERLLAVAGTRPEAPFLTHLSPDGSAAAFRYADLLSASARWAGLMRRHGCGAGARIVIVLEPGLDLYAAFLGALRLGAVPSVFYYPSAKYDRARYLAEMRTLLAASGARLIVAYPELAGALRSLVTDLPAAPAVVAQGEAAEATPVDATGDRAGTQAVAFMQYSSGTTGLKKGLELDHRAALWQLDAYAECLELAEDEVFVSWLPLYHDMGLIACMLLPMLRGLPIVGMTPHAWVTRPVMWLEAVARYRGTRAWMPNFAFNLLARRCAGAGCDLSSLRSLVNCSEPVLAASHDAFLQAFAPDGVSPEALATCYAMAETTFAVTQSAIGMPPSRDTVDPECLTREGRAVPSAEGRTLMSSGQALPETEIEIRDGEGRVLQERRVGEIFVRTPSLFAGYHANPEATAAVLRDGVYATGDLGYLADGQLYVVGRAKDIVVVGGQNLYPQDVESVLEGIAGLVPGRAVAFGVDDATRGTQRLVVMAEGDGSVPEEDLRSAIGERVAAATRVAAGDIRIVAPRTLVKSSAGKLSRSANRDLYLADAPAPAPRAAGPAEGADGLAGTVLKVVRARLATTPAVGPARAARVGVDTSLIAGGLIDSFGLVDLVAALESALDRTLPLSLMADPDAMDTVRAIVACLEAGRDDGAAPELPDAPARIEDIALRHAAIGSPRHRMGFWSLYYRAVFRRHGIAYGSGLRVLGPLLLRLDGDARNLRLGRNVTLMPWVDLKLREAGRIELGDDTVLDTTVRLVAAREGAAILGDRAQIGMGTIVNAGDLVALGRDSAVAAHCNLIASEHRLDSAGPVMEAGYVRKPVLVGEGVWIAAGCILRPGARIGAGAVVGAQSVVEGALPGQTLAAGAPARPIRRLAARTTP